MFFTLGNNHEYQRDCELVPSKDSMVLALEKENKKERKRKMKRCCSACSIREKRIELGRIRNLEMGDLLEYYKPPVEVAEGSRGIRFGCLSG